jgi:hypothetical protein
VGKYEVASDHNGGAIIVWDQGDLDEMFILHMNQNGDIQFGPQVIVPEGENPSLFVSSEGEAYLAWLENRKFFYTPLSLANLSQAQPFEAVNHSIWGTLNSTGDKLVGPTIGYADGWVYIAWSILSLTDVEAGTAVLEYVSFPAHSPTADRPIRIWTIGTEEQPYIDYEGVLPFSQLGPSMDLVEAASEFGEKRDFETRIAGDWVDIAGAASEFLMNPSVMVGQANELAIAMAVNQQMRTDAFLQVATGIFENGKYIGYSIASKTRGNSDNPVLVLDEGNNLHIAWREGALRDSVFYATTAPTAMAEMDRFQTSDFLFAGAQAVIESSVSLAFLPFVGLGWMLPGLVLLGIWKLYNENEEVTQPKSWIPLSISIALFYAVKFISLPTLTTYTPFSAWIQIPKEVQPFLRLGIPILIFIISVLVANKFRQRSSNSTILFYIIFVLTDAILTLIIYGVNFLGAT